MDYKKESAPFKQISTVAFKTNGQQVGTRRIKRHLRRSLDFIALYGFFFIVWSREGAFVLRDATTSRCPEAWDH